jgi:hypothetical protein
MNTVEPYRPPTQTANLDQIDPTTLDPATIGAMTALLRQVDLMTRSRTQYLPAPVTATGLPTVRTEPVPALNATRVLRDSNPPTLPYQAPRARRRLYLRGEVGIVASASMLLAGPIAGLITHNPTAVLISLAGAFGIPVCAAMINRDEA